MNTNIEEALKELLDRSIRTETRVVQLGDHVGANLRSKQRIDIEPTPTSVVAYIDALDVSLSRVAAEVTRSPYWDIAPPGVHHIDIRLGHRTEYVIAGTLALLKKRGP